MTAGHVAPDNDDHDFPVRQASGAAISQIQGTLGTAAPDSETDTRAQKGLELAQFAMQTRPSLFARPELRFPLATMQKRLGLARDAEGYFRQLSASALDSGWRTCGEAELWLAHGQGKAPKTIANCYRTPARPRLDAQLSDAVWQTARPLPLQSELRDDATWPAAAMFAYDDEFLYIALVCRRTEADDYAPDDSDRMRDQDLQGRDRVDILLDVDRDYATSYRLTIDSRGWANDACCGDSTWDPQWFIAHQDDGQSWIVEAAIPWSELGPAAPNHNDVWALGVQRTAPRTGFQAWTTPSAVDPLPQGFGLIVFQQ